MVLRDSEMLPVGCVLQPLFCTILTPLYVERLAAIDASDAEAADELEDATAEV